MTIGLSTISLLRISERGITMQNHPIIKLIKESNYLPQIPKAFGETLNMLLEPSEFDMNECIEKISSLPRLEAILIQVLNYGTKLNREILTLKDAVLYLGAKNVRTIAIMFITRLLLSNKDGRTKIFNNRAYWKHCIGTSIAGHMIAVETGLCDKDKMFTYGLIHDIGVTVLDICLPEHLDKIFSLQLKGLHQVAAEKIVLSGLTHMEIGMWLCDEWGLPEEIKDIVKYHHTPFINSNTNNEIRILHLADAISTNYYERLLGNNKNFIYLDKTMELLNLSKEFVDDIARRLPKEVDKVDRIVSFDL